MKREKITFACTVFNEEYGIGKFLDSILSQSVSPDEIIVVDGGSIDRTVEIVKEYQKKSKVPIKLIIKKGANIAKGRNTYMGEVKSGFLFSGDSGTRFEKDWIKKILKGFETGADVVFGIYEPEKARTTFEKIVNARVRDYSKYTEEDWNREEPSNRQAAYRISSWKKVGKFPEWMNRADDAWMYEKAKKIGLTFYAIRDAKVYWYPRRNLKQYLNLAYQDSVSDGIAVNIILRRKIYFAEFLILFATLISFGLSFLNIRYLFFGIGLIAAIFLIYGLKLAIKTKDIAVFFYGGLISVLLFFAHAIGGVVGLLIKFFRKIRGK